MSEERGREKGYESGRGGTRRWEHTKRDGGGLKVKYFVEQGCSGKVMMEGREEEGLKEKEMLKGS